MTKKVKDSEVKDKEKDTVTEQDVAEETIQSKENAEHEVSEADDLSAKLDKSEKELAQCKDSLLRLQADFENYRKRNAQIRTDALCEGKISVISELLKSIDNFERALNVECSDEGFAKGMQMIYKMMTDSLRNMGLEEIDANGMFDPNFHEAVMQDESGESESGTITAVLQKGYKFGGKVIRPSMVRVAK